MSQETVRIRQGEKVVLTGEASLPGGTLTLANPAPTATLYQRRRPVAGFIDLSITDAILGPTQKMAVAYALDTSGLPLGLYTLVFTFTADGSDGETRVFKPARNLRILTAGAED